MDKDLQAFPAAVHDSYVISGFNSPPPNNSQCSRNVKKRTLVLECMGCEISFLPTPHMLEMYRSAVLPLQGCCFSLWIRTMVTATLKFLHGGLVVCQNHVVQCPSLSLAFLKRPHCAASWERVDASVILRLCAPLFRGLSDTKCPAWGIHAWVNFILVVCSLQNIILQELYNCNERDLQSDFIKRSGYWIFNKVILRSYGICGNNTICSYLCGVCGV